MAYNTSKGLSTVSGALGQVNSLNVGGSEVISSAKDVHGVTNVNATGSILASTTVRAANTISGAVGQVNALKVGGIEVISAAKDVHNVTNISATGSILASTTVRATTTVSGASGRFNSLTVGPSIIVTPAKDVHNVTNINATGSLILSGAVRAGSHPVHKHIFTGSVFLGAASGDSTTIAGQTIKLSNVQAGTDNTVLVYNGSSIVTDEIDAKVWAGNLIDVTGTPADNQLAVWTDSDTLEGESSITFNASTLSVANTVKATNTISGALGQVNSLKVGGAEVISAAKDVHGVTNLNATGSLRGHEAIISGAVRAGSHPVHNHIFTGSVYLGAASGDETTIAGQSIVLPNLQAGTDNTVLVYNGSSIVSDEIDAKVWAGKLIDYTGTPVNNQLAVWTDSDTLEGESSITFNASTLSVTNTVKASTTISGATAQANLLKIGGSEVITSAKNVHNVTNIHATGSLFTSGAIRVGTHSTTNHILTGSLNVSGDLTMLGDTHTFSSANATDPVLIVKNTNTDADGARLRFVKDAGEAGADNDVAGVIEFYADDDNQDQVLFAKIQAEVADASNGAEGGKLLIGVATHDGEFQNGLLIADGSAEDEVDVTIGQGAESLVTIAGDLDIPNGGFALGSDASGDMYYRNSSGILTRIAAGGDNQVLTLDGAVPGWEAAGGGSARSVAGDTDNGMITWVTSDNTFAAEADCTFDSNILSVTNTVKATTAISGALGQFNNLKVGGAEIVSSAKDLHGVTNVNATGSILASTTVRATTIMSGATGQVNLLKVGGAEVISAAKDVHGVTNLNATGSLILSGAVRAGSHAVHKHIFTGSVFLGNASGDSVTIAGQTIKLSNVQAGTDNTVLVYDGSSILTDEIDAKVWAGNLIDVTGTPADNQVAVWTDADTVEGTSNLTYASSILTVTNTVKATNTISGALGQVNSLKVGGSEVITAAKNVHNVTNIHATGSLFTSGAIRVGTHSTTNHILTGSLSISGPLKSFALGSDASGDMYYRNSSGVLTRIAAGGDNQVLTLDGAVPGWEAASGGGSGDVSAGSTFTTAGVIMACDGSDKTIDEPGATLTTNGQDMTIEGGDLALGLAANTNATTINPVASTGTDAGKNLTISAGASTIGANNINGGDLVLSSGGGDGTGTSTIQFKTKVNGTDATGERMRIGTLGHVGIGETTPKTALSVTHDYNSTTFETQLSDGEGGGRIMRYSPGADDTLTVGQLYFLHTDGTWDACDADAVATGGSQMLGVGLGSARSVGVLLEGFVRIPSTEILNTPGSGAVDGLPVYVSTTAGHFDFTAPSTAGDFVRVVGYAIDDDSGDVLVYFNPDKTWVEL